jgi:alpha-2-macroglobulin
MTRKRTVLWCISAFFFSFGLCMGIKLLRSKSAARATAAEPVASRRDPVKELLNQVVPLQGAVRHPHAPARFDMGLSVAVRSKNAKPGLGELRSAAVARQKRLLLAWKRCKTQSAAKDHSPAQRGRRAVLAYAFGELALADALVAGRSGGEDLRLRMARLLMAECRFEAGVRELMALAGGKGSRSEAALALLVRHQQERRALRKRGLDLLPVGGGLDRFLARRGRSSKARASIESIRSVVRPLLPPRDVQKFLREENPVEVRRDIFRATTRPLLMPVARMEVAPGSLGRAYLQLFNHDLVLYLRSREVQAGSKVTIDLRSLYCGPMEFRLYRFRREQEWRELNAKSLAKLKAVRRWEKTYRPLAENTSGKAWDGKVEVDGLGEGYYLLTCSARFAPMLAAQKFGINNVSLYLRAGRNRAVIAANNKLSSKPQAGLPVELNLYGTPDNLSIRKSLRPQSAEAFDLGQKGIAASADVRLDLTPAGRLSWERSYAQGREARRRYPVVERKLKGRTGKDGCASFRLDIGRRFYAYRLVARRSQKAFAVSVANYTEPQDAATGTKALVWAAQPVYRPGGRIRIKGVVRRMAVTGPQLPERKSVDLVVASSDRKCVLWKGKRQLSKAGCFDLDFELPENPALGEYSVLVEGARVSPQAPFSIEEFRLPPFHVSLDVDCRDVPGGGRATGSIKVGYFSGTPAKGAEIEVSIIGFGAKPHQLEADISGRAIFNLPVPALERDRSLEVLVSAKDRSGRSCHTWKQILGRASAFKLEADVFPARARKGDDVEVRVRASRWSGLPLAGVELQLKGCKDKQRTGKNGAARFRLKAGSDGAQLFDVLARFGKQQVEVRAGRFSPVARKVTDAGQLRVSVPSDTDLGNDLEIKLHNGGKESCNALIFLENTQLVAYRVMQVAPGESILRIPTTPEFAPNVHLGIFTIGKRGYSREARLEAKVVPAHRFLTLEVVTDRLEYRPGDRCQVLVRALDWKGKPVRRAEVSLGVVSEAVYDVRKDPTPDIRDFFCKYRLPRWPVGGIALSPPGLAPVTLWKGPRYAWGYLVQVEREDAISDIPLGGTGVTGVMGVGGGGMSGVFGFRSSGGMRRAIARFGGSAAGERMPPRVRKNFRNTAHWVASLVTNRRGEARVSFKLPDDIGSWRFTARGLTADTKVGQVVVKREALLPLEVDLVLPRAMRVGDEVELGAAVRNNRGMARFAQVRWSGDAGKGSKKLWVSRGGCARAGFEFRPASVGLRTFRATVLSDGRDSDAAERKATVLPRGFPASRSFRGVLARGGKVPLNFGTEALPGTLKLVISGESGLAGPLESALDSLIDYPYGCVEQTMSRFMPAVVAARAMKSKGLRCERAAMLPAVFEKSLARLIGFQHADGGWGWWRSDATNDFMTAYVLEGLSLCRGAGQAIPAKMMNRAERLLFDRLASGKLNNGRRISAVGACDLKLYVARALALRYSLEPGVYAAQRKRLSALLPKGKLKSSDLLLRADILRLLGRKEQAAAEFKKAVGGMKLNVSTRQGAIAAGRLLEIGAALDPDGSNWSLIACSLVKARKGNGWGDTQATAAAVRGLAAVLDTLEGNPAKVDVLIDGRKVGTITPRKGARRRLVLTRRLDGAREVSLRVRSGGGGFWSAELTGTTAEPPQPPRNPVVNLKVRYFRKGGRRGEIKPDRNGNLKVKLGETIEMVLECDLKRALSFLRVSIPRPCGVEILRAPKLERGLSAFEERDDGLHFFIGQWKAGKHQLRIAVRAEAAGKIFAPYPELSPMYGEAVPTAVDAATEWAVER